MEKKTPIELAVIFKNAGCVEVLLEKEQNADILYEIRQKETNRTLLHLACMTSECEKIVPILVKKALDDEVKIQEEIQLQKTNTNIFQKSAKTSKKFNSRRGMNFLNLTDFEDNTAIHLATKHGYTNSVMFLRDQGANCGILNVNGELPILLAAGSGDYHAFWALKEQTPTKILQKEIHKIFIAAIHSNCDKIVEDLADDFNNKNTLKNRSGTLVATRNNKSSKSPVIEALRKSNLKVSKLLLNFGFVPPRDQIVAVLPDLLKYGDSSEFFELLFEFGCIGTDFKIGKNYLLKIILTDEGVIDRMNLVNVFIKNQAVCRSNIGWFWVIFGSKWPKSTKKCQKVLFLAIFGSQTLGGSIRIIFIYSVFLFFKSSFHARRYCNNPLGFKPSNPEGNLRRLSTLTLPFTRKYLQIRKS